MSLSRSSHRYRLEHIPYLLLSMLLVAPLGFGVPYLLTSEANFGFGLIFVLLLLGPSIWATGLLAGKLAGDQGAAGLHLLGGCLAPFVGFAIFGVGFGMLDSLCESDVLACGTNTIWLTAGVLWAALVFVWVCAATFLRVGHPDSPEPS
jgi:hypothetical protein